MPRIKHTVEQIITKLRETEVVLSKGPPVAQVCHTLGITEQTYYRWWNEYGA
jgi:putative transposase